MRPGESGAQRERCVGVERQPAIEAGAELAAGQGRGRIYIVEPSGEFEDDPNVTNKRFPGNPTQSFRSREPLRVVGELLDWVGHSPEKLEAMRARLDSLQREGTGKIED